MKKIKGYVRKLSGPNQGNKYPRYFKTEEERDKKMRYYEDRWSEMNLPSIDPDPERVEIANRSHATKAKKYVNKVIKFKSGLELHRNLIRSIENSDSPNKLRSMAEEMAKRGYRSEAFLSKAKADRIEKSYENAEKYSDVIDSFGEKETITDRLLRQLLRRK